MRVWVCLCVCVCGSLKGIVYGSVDYSLISAQRLLKIVFRDSKNLIIMCGTDHRSCYIFDVDRKPLFQ